MNGFRAEAVLRVVVQTAVHGVYCWVRARESWNWRGDGTCDDDEADSDEEGGNSSLM